MQVVSKTAKPVQKRCQMGPVFLRNTGEFQPHTSCDVNVTHHSLGSDLPFFHKKIYLSGGAHGLRFVCLNK